jgi:hypothetical protein
VRLLDDLREKHVIHNAVKPDAPFEASSVVVLWCGLFTLFGDVNHVFERTSSVSCGAIDSLSIANSSDVFRTVIRFGSLQPALNHLQRAETLLMEGTLYCRRASSSPCCGPLTHAFAIEQLQSHILHKIESPPTSAHRSSFLRWRPKCWLSS